jgi:predicted NAD/FAD-dependent oxidoreductase
MTFGRIVKYIIQTKLCTFFNRDGMSDYYDLVIIGSGPSGLALAQCVSHLNKKILIIEKEDKIGGCHGVTRINGIFSEHGPRVYSSSFINFQELLKEMNVSFYDLFTKYKFLNYDFVVNTVLSALSFEDISILTLELFYVIFNNDHGKDITMVAFLQKKGFSPKSTDLIDRICKLIDGGGIDKYTLNQFIVSINQKMFYDVYQPVLPNDIGLLKIWREYLESNNVTIMTDTKMKQIKFHQNNINHIVLDSGNIIRGGKFVFAVPPKHLLKIVEQFNIPHSWGDIKTFAQENSYIHYISIVFHWDKELKLKDTHGFPRSVWGLVFIKLSDYMDFKEAESKTVISCAISIRDTKSLHIGKTANECNEKELIVEIFRQLQESYGILPFPTKVILYPEVKYEEREWITQDTAYILTQRNEYLPYQNDVIHNMYNLGTHNGKSFYKSTVIESAVSNSIVLSKVLYPELNDTRYIKLKKIVTFIDIARITILFILLYVIYMMIQKKYIIYIFDIDS